MVQEKEKHLEEVLKDKNLDQVLQLKVLKVVKCHYIEDYLKEVLTQSQLKIAILNLKKIQSFIDKKTINPNEILNADLLKKHKIINKNSTKLKILGTGEIKE